MAALQAVFGNMAQLAERPAVNRKTAGSIPVVPVSGASSNGRAPVLYAEDAGSIPAAPTPVMLISVRGARDTISVPVG